MIPFVPTRRALSLAALALVPAVLAMVDPVFGWLALSLDLSLLALCVADLLLAPRDVSAERLVEPVLSSGVPNVVRLRISGKGPCRGEVRDALPPGLPSDGHRLPFSLVEAEPERWLSYRVTPPSRGDLPFGDLFLRVQGPFGFAARQLRVTASASVKVYPDLTALTKDALSLATLAESGPTRAFKKIAEGREFESLREYQQGDDYRTIDWKSSARRGRSMVRNFEPERNQAVWLLLDCGRHMAGLAEGRRKLDHAVDAALRLAKVTLDKGDLVGLCAFARDVRAFLPPKKGQEHLRSLTSALYRVEASLEESDYGQALDLCFARHHRRSLVVLFTELSDLDTSNALVARTLALKPRHLPLVVSLTDPELEHAAADFPKSVDDAYVRYAASKLVEEQRLTSARLRQGGARVVRAAARSFGAAAVNEYLGLKARGVL